MPNSRATANHDEYMGDGPEWRDFVSYELEMLDKMFPNYVDNADLGCDKVGKVMDEKDGSDSFEAPSLESSDSSDHDDLRRAS